MFLIKKRLKDAQYLITNLIIVKIAKFKIRTLPFLFNFFELKERAHIRRKINSQRSVYMRNQYYYCFDLAKIRVVQARTTKH